MFHSNYAARIAAGFDALMEVETEVQLAGGAADCLEPTKQNIATFTLALFVELAELTQEMNWKPWKDHHRVDPVLAGKEYADLLAFLALNTIYLIKSSGLTTKELAQFFLEKSELNIRRLSGRVEGYGYSQGFKTKESEAERLLLHPDNQSSRDPRGRAPLEPSDTPVPRAIRKLEGSWTTEDPSDPDR